jgi:hypothetical protein
VGLKGFRRAAEGFAVRQRVASGGWIKRHPPYGSATRARGGLTAAHHLLGGEMAGKGAALAWVADNIQARAVAQ